MTLLSFVRLSAVLGGYRRVTRGMREVFALVLLLSGVSDCRMGDPELL